MARRRRPEGEPPERLLTFEAHQWPGSVHQAHAAWKAAREEWYIEHGWPGGESGWFGAQVDADRVTPSQRFDVEEFRWPPSAREVWRERLDAGDQVTADAIRVAVEAGRTAEARDLAAKARS